MEVFPQVQPLWQVQLQLAEKVLKLNAILSALDSTQKKLTPEEWMEFLQLLLELETVFLPELIAMEETRPLAEAFEIFKINKEEFEKRYPYRIFVWWGMKGAGSIVKFKTYKNEEELQEDYEENWRKKSYKIVKKVILPTEIDMILLARAILRIGLQMEILRFMRKTVPKAKLGEVYNGRERARLAIKRICGE